MEFDFVDPVPAGIVAAQHRRVLVRQPRQPLAGRVAGQAA